MKSSPHLPMALVLAEVLHVTDARPKVNAPKRSGGDGVPEVFCSDEQDAVPIELERWRRLAIDALVSQGVRGACELSLFFVDVETISDLNTEHMGKSGPTDVLAFPLDGVEVAEMQGPGALTRGPSRPHPDHDDMPTLLGDVLVCPAVAEKQAPTHAGNFDDEIALLVVHGILHILGFDHDNDENLAVMRAAEVAILAKHHWNGSVPDGFQQGHNE
jgi:probable rRNA maturation factor